MDLIIFHNFPSLQFLVKVTSHYKKLLRGSENLWPLIVTVPEPKYRRNSFREKFSQKFVNKKYFLIAVYGTRKKWVSGLVIRW
jgi:hypothetical protein